MALRTITLTVLCFVASGVATAQQKPSGFTPDLAQQLGKLLDQDWNDRPLWGDMLIELLQGKQMGPNSGWWRPSNSRFGWEWLKQEFAEDGSERITVKQLTGLLEAGRLKQYFGRLDRNRNGSLSKLDFNWSPGNSYDRRNPFAAMMFYNIDTDSNGRVTNEELNEFFRSMDRNQAGYLTYEELLDGLSAPPNFGPPPPGTRMPTQMDFVAMMLRGELGYFHSAPLPGEEAPDFTLKTHDGLAQVTLSQFRGNKPVVLVFGSYT